MRRGKKRGEEVRAEKPSEEDWRIEEEEERAEEEDPTRVVGKHRSENAAHSHKSSSRARLCHNLLTSDAL